MPKINFYADAVNRELETGKIPDLSHNLESVRSYQFEIVFNSTTGEGPIPNGLTLAAKQVSPIGVVLEDIVANRVNDKFYYPGKPTPEELTVTFDNLLLGNTSKVLYDWFSSIYDSRTGNMTPNFIEGKGIFKTNMQIYELDSTRKPIRQTQLYGCYPKTWKEMERNYSTNEFHTLEMVFRYDFVNKVSNPND